MKEEKVPQDSSNLNSANLKELCYAVDKEGKYVTAKSSGWEPKTIALNNAIQDINDRVSTSKERVLNNEASPVEYYMELHKMDLGILASYVGFFKWSVKRHMKPKVFGSLSKNKLQRYADVFEITIEQLKNIEHGN